MVEPRILHTPKPGEVDTDRSDYEVSVSWRRHKVTMHGRMSWVKGHESHPRIFVEKMRQELSECLVIHLVRDGMSELDARALAFPKIFPAPDAA